MKISPVKSNFYKNYYKNNPKPAAQTAPDYKTTAQTYGLGYYMTEINFGGNNVKTLSKEEFINLCAASEDKNYRVSAETMKTGSFCLDLHSHSNHSDGHGNVEEILDDVAYYADELYKKTGKNFTFALTDHDGVSGVIEAQKIISEDKEKYKHVNFIPGVELSFVFTSGGKVRSGELLGYFIDPESKEIEELVTKLRENRKNMFNDGIHALGKGFEYRETVNYFINCDGETFSYNLHGRLRNYAQIKNRVNKMAKEYRLDPEALYKYLMDDFVFNPDGTRKINKPYVNPENFDKYLKEISFDTETEAFDPEIEEICLQFFPKVQDGKVISNTENDFSKIIDVFKNNDKVLLGFAHPYFTALEEDDYKACFDNLLSKANGRVTFSEKYHMAYPRNIIGDDKEKQRISDINEYLSSRGLIPVGGRDNHSPRFLP